MYIQRRPSDQKKKKKTSHFLLTERQSCQFEPSEASEGLQTPKQSPTGVLATQRGQM